METALSSVPPLTKLMRRLHAISCVLLEAKSASNTRDNFVHYIQDVIPVLENSHRSLSNEDIERVQALIRKLSTILQKLSDQSRIGRIRAIYLSQTCRFDDIRREVDAALGLIELKTVVVLQGRMDELFSLVENGAHHAEGDSDPRRPCSGPISASADDPSSSAQNVHCICGLQNISVNASPPAQAQDTHDSRGSVSWSPIQSSSNKGSANSDSLIGSEAFSRTLFNALRNVEQHRHLVQTTGGHRVCLANSLSLLADLLKQDGRLEDAVRLNQEAVELYLAADESVLKCTTTGKF